MITAGIDCGAQYTKAVIIGDGAIRGKGLVLTGFDLVRAAEEALNGAMTLAAVGRQDLQKIYVTGSGKDAIKIGDGSVSEIKAMASGAHFFFRGARTVADVGAEEGRAARLDEKGHPVDFVINEKCAAGAGAFIEAMARALEMSVAEIGPLSLQSDHEIPLNAQCAIFAESEVVGLIHSRASKPDISKAIHDAVASRVVSMIRRLGVHEDVALLGGLGRNPGFVASMTQQLKVQQVFTAPDPEFGAAVGAAVCAAEDFQ
jgi:benzoyl-CoA reductase subunit D